MQQPPQYYPQQSPYNGQPGGNVYNDGYTIESGFLGEQPGFSDIKIRHGFVRKVYGIVSFQVMITIAFIALIKYTPPITTFFVSNLWLLWVFMLGTFIVMIVLACCESVSRTYPLNMILLFAFTIMESVLLGVITIQYKTDTVLIAAALTAFIVIGLTIFAFQTKIDFTGMGTYLFVMCLVLFGFGLIAIIVRSNIMHIIYAALGAGLFSMYLVFDTQLMLGGKHKYSISPEDYIIAALNLYVDIINLFLMILRLVSAAKD
jgi:FtsH-binding integral membrane protein